MRLIRKEKNTKMMTDSDDQYGKSTSSNMLMDCIQFAVVIRALMQTHPGTENPASAVVTGDKHLCPCTLRSAAGGG